MGHEMAALLVKMVFSTFSAIAVLMVLLIFFFLNMGFCVRVLVKQIISADELRSVRVQCFLLCVYILHILHIAYTLL